MSSMVTSAPHIADHHGEPLTNSHYLLLSLSSLSFRRWPTVTSITTGRLPAGTLCYPQLNQAALSFRSIHTNQQPLSWLGRLGAALWYATLHFEEIVCSSYLDMENMAGCILPYAVCSSYVFMLARLRRLTVLQSLYSYKWKDT